MLRTDTEQGDQNPVDSETQTKRGMSGTQKEAIAVGVALLVVVVIAVFALTSLNPTPTTPAPTPTSTNPSWHMVSTYSGSGTDSYGNPVAINTNTATFTIKGAQFKLVWSYTTAYPESQTYAVYDYPPLSTYSDGSALPVICETSDSLTASHGCGYTTNSTNAGTETLDQGPGSYYLQIVATSVDWQITVQDYY